MEYCNYKIPKPVYVDAKKYKFNFESDAGSLLVKLNNGDNDINLSLFGEGDGEHFCYIFENSKEFRKSEYYNNAKCIMSFKNQVVKLMDYDCSKNYHDEGEEIVCEMVFVYLLKGNIYAFVKYNGE